LDYDLSTGCRAVSEFAYLVLTAGIYVVDQERFWTQVDGVNDRRSATQSTESGQDRSPDYGPAQTSTPEIVVAQMAAYYRRDLDQGAG